MIRKILCSFSNVVRLPTRLCSCVCHPSPVPSNTKLTILDNGVRVATETNASSVAGVALFIEAGSRFETACNNGITHFVEHMAYKGFNSMNRCQLQELLRCMGAKMTAYTSREIQVFSAKCLTDNVPVMVGILSNVIADLALNECDVEVEKMNMQLELMDADRDPRTVLFDYLHATAFQGTPLAKRVIGTSENIERFDKFYTTAFLCEHYQPYKLALIGVGNIHHENMVCYAQAKLGHMVGDPCCESEEGPTRFTGSQVLFRDDSMPFAHVAVAFEVSGYNSPDYMQLLTAKNMIGTWRKGQGGGTKNGFPLAQAAATEDICEYFESFYIPYRDVGLWGIYFVARKMDVEDMLHNIQNAWMHLCVTTQFYDVERAVNQLKLQFAKNIEGNMRSCHDLGLQTMYSCGRSGLDDMFHELKGIEQQGLKAVMDKYIYDRCPAVAAIGPVEGLPEYTRIRAGQYWLRL
ncbi:cytochrome b-c1 complex subunit 1, mitochondrial-like [Ostrinia nubilalis]|uniref:cytochrome b-c1 complex subunit 1, mitochondrial-like n=1 Tax=Ostrinia nubilalis TaxID=29057 RepID=UPI00308257DD